MKKLTLIFTLILTQILPFGAVHAASNSNGDIHFADASCLRAGGFDSTRLSPFAEGDWRSKDTVNSCPSGTEKSTDGCCCIPQ